MNAYYERLYEKLQGARNILMSRVREVLSEEIIQRKFRNFSEEKYCAYQDTCIAFIEERIEAYNPTGIQYTFDNIRSRLSHELEMHLDWYDSREEFAKLLEAAHKEAEPAMSNEAIREKAEDLIRKFGAFPDGSIIHDYKNKPDLQKLPDYVAARVIEEAVR